MGRSTRGTRVITSLKYLPASIWRIWAGSGAQTTGASLLVGPTPGRGWVRAPGGHGECPRRNHGEAAGTKWGSSPVERTAVERGNRSGPHPPIRAAGTDRRGGVPGCRSDREGRGGG